MDNTKKMIKVYRGENQKKEKHFRDQRVNMCSLETYGAINSIVNHTKLIDLIVKQIHSI